MIGKIWAIANKMTTQVLKERVGELVIMDTIGFITVVYHF